MKPLTTIVALLFFLPPVVTLAQQTPVAGYSLVSKNNGRYDDTINIGSTALISIAGITATYHMILAHDSRRAAVDYLNLRQ